MGIYSTITPTFAMTNAAVERFLRVHFVKQSKLPTGTPVGFSYLIKDKSQIMRTGKDSAFIASLLAAHYNPKSDYYITGNTFKSTRCRNTENIFSLHNIIVDCDAHEIKDAVACAIVCERLRRDLLTADYRHLHIPPPNSIVCTGRGIQIWWSLNPITMKTEDLYKKVCCHFSNAISSFINGYPDYRSFSVDSAASNNRAGLFRLPGTYNTKTRTKTDVVVLTEKMYNIFELKQFLPIKNKGIKTSKKKSSSFSMIRERNGSKYSYKEIPDENIFLSRAQAIARLAEIRDYKVSGFRDLILWLYHNDLIKCMEPDEAFRIACDLNNRFNDPFDDVELAQKLSANECAVSYVDGRQGYAVTTRYIIDRLQITPEESEEIGLQTSGCSLTAGNAIHVNQSKKLKKQVNKNKRILAAAKRGESQTSIARRFGLCRATVNRLVKRSGLQDRIRHTNKMMKMSDKVIQKRKTTVSRKSEHSLSRLNQTERLDIDDGAILIFSYNDLNDLRDQQ